MWSIENKEFPEGSLAEEIETIPECNERRKGVDDPRALKFSANEVVTELQ
jgi:hypothetical protein